MDQETIQQTAQGMIRNFGRNAYGEAMANVDSFRKSHDPQDAEGVCNWLAIAAAIAAVTTAPAPAIPASVRTPAHFPTILDKTHGQTRQR